MHVLISFETIESVDSIPTSWLDKMFYDVLCLGVCNCPKTNPDWQRIYCFNTSHILICCVQSVFFFNIHTIVNKFSYLMGNLNSHTFHSTTCPASNWGAQHQRSQLKPHVHEVIPWGFKRHFAKGLVIFANRIPEGMGFFQVSASWIRVETPKIAGVSPNYHIFGIDSWSHLKIALYTCTIWQTLSAVRNAFFCQQKRKRCPEFIKTFHGTRRFKTIFFQFQDVGSTLRTQYINQIHCVYHKCLANLAPTNVQCDCGIWLI